MKTLTIITLIGLVCGFCFSASGQGITTLVSPLTTVSGYSTNNAFSLSEGQVMRLLHVEGSDNSQTLRAYRDGVQILSVSQGAFDPQRTYTIAGPAEVLIRNYYSGSGSPERLAATIDIQPAQYPPDKSAVIGERDGPMKCTLEESTDLVNWTQSTSGQTHSLTNVNAKKFFRIKLEQDVGQ